MIDERLERAAIALFKASTNWAKTPDRDMVLNLWNMQMDAIRDSFRTKVRAVMAELDEPSDMEPPADMGNTLIVTAKDITDDPADVVDQAEWYRWAGMDGERHLCPEHAKPEGIFVEPEEPIGKDDK